jgi:hypothetical protein
MGRLKADRLGLGSQGQLGLRLSRPARAVGWLGVLGRLGLQSITGGSSWPLLVLGPWRQAAFYLRLLVLARLGCFVAFSSRLGLLLLAGWWRLSSSLHWQDGPRWRSRRDQVRRAGSGAADVRARACGRRGRVRGRTSRWCSGKSPKGSAATRTRCRGAGVWSPRTARPWRGRGVATVVGRGAGKAKRGSRQKGGSTARARGKGAHARTRVLVFQGRGVAVPPASRARGTTRRRGRRRLRGLGGGAAGPCTRTALRPGRGGGPRDCYRGIIGLAGSSGGRKRGGGRDAHRRG